MHAIPLNNHGQNQETYNILVTTKIDQAEHSLSVRYDRYNPFYSSFNLWLVRRDIPGKDFAVRATGSLQFPLDMVECRRYHLTIRGSDGCHVARRRPRWCPLSSQTLIESSMSITLATTSLILLRYLQESSSMHSLRGDNNPLSFWIYCHVSYWDAFHVGKIALVRIAIP
jgi:hypothetical protein